MRTRRSFAAALALGAACALPTAVALSEDPHALKRPGGVWPGSSAGSAVGSSGGGDACEEAGVGAWWLPLVHQLQRLQQLAGGVQQDTGAEEEDDGFAVQNMDEAEEDVVGAVAHAEADADLVGGPTREQAAGLAQQQGLQQLGKAGLQSSGSRGGSSSGSSSGAVQHSRSRRAPDVPASLLAAGHREELAEMRQLVLAELARLRVVSAAEKQQAEQGAGQRRGRRRTAQEEGGLPAAAAAAAAAAAEAAAVPTAEAAAAAAKEELPSRLQSDAELFRFAMMAGYLRAKTPQQRQAALREGAASAARTAVWLREHPFSSQQELERYAHLVSWEGTDADGHPILRISIGRAVSECHGSAALAFANATITHMEQGLAQRLQDFAPTSGGSSSSGSGGNSGGSSSGGGQDALQAAIGAGGLLAADGGAPLGSSSNNSSSSRSSGCSSYPSSDPSSTTTNSNSDSNSGSDGSGASLPSRQAGGASAAGAPLAAAAAATQPAAVGSDSRSPAEQLVVVMDCSGASALSAARISWVCQAVASTMSHHYPGRLHELVLLDLPRMLSWMVKGVKAVSHPDSRHKFRIAHSAQPISLQRSQDRARFAPVHEARHQQQQPPPPLREGEEKEQQQQQQRRQNEQEDMEEEQQQPNSTGSVEGSNCQQGQGSSPPEQALAQQAQQREPLKELAAGDDAQQSVHETQAQQQAPEQ